MIFNVDDMPDVLHNTCACITTHNTTQIYFSLKERQNQWKLEEEERLAKVPDPSIPPGHTLMPTDERLKTLKVLRERKFHQ